MIRADVREVPGRIEVTGHIETAYRVLQLCSSIFDFAVVEELCDHNPCVGLSKVLPERVERHHASITDPKKVGEFRLLVRVASSFPVHAARYGP